MPEDLSMLHVVGRTADGLLWHTRRLANGAWTSFDPLIIASEFRHVTDVACTRRLRPPFQTQGIEGLYVFVAFDDAPPKLLFRDADTNSWSEEGLSGFPIVRGVAAGTYSSIGLSAHAELHLAAVTHDGRLIASEHNYGATTSISPLQITAAGPNRGPFTGVTMTAGTGLDTSGSANALVALNAAGSLFYTEGSSASGWQPFDQLAGKSMANPGMADFVDVDVTLESTGPSVVAVTGDGHVWLTKRQSNGTWTSWGDLEITTTTTVFYDPFGNHAGSATTTSGVDVGTFGRISTANTSVGLHVVGVTTDGHLWHQLRPAVSTATPVFGDVERFGVGQDVGFFTAVTCV